MNGSDANLRQLLRSILLLLVLGAIVVALLAAVPSLAAVTRELSHAQTGWVALAVVAELASCLAFVAFFQGIFWRGPRRLAARLAWTEMAAGALLPAGGAGGLGLGAFVLRKLGMPGRAIAIRSSVVFLITSAVTVGALSVFGFGLAAGVFEGPRKPLLTLLPALVGVVVIGLCMAANMLPIPGGIGAVDLGLVGMLAVYGAPLSTAAAAVLIYRAISLWVPTLVGTVAYVLLRGDLRRPITPRGGVRPAREHAPTRGRSADPGPAETAATPAAEARRDVHTGFPAPLSLVPNADKGEAAMSPSADIPTVTPTDEPSRRPDSDAPRLADTIVKAGRIYAMDERRATFRSLAVRDGRIVAVSEESDGLDALASSGTSVLDDSELTMLPAFFDVHEHLLDSARNLGRVRLEDARSIAELVALIRERAKRTPAGEWVQTSNGWNESNLTEGRLPTAIELDEATSAHPVLAPRGGHVSITNTLGLKQLEITSETPDPPGGTIGRLETGTPNGILEGSAAQMIKGLVPPPPLEESVQDLAAACKIYAALGVGSVREALLLADGWEVYQSAWEQGRLSIRCLPLLLVDSSWPQEQRLAFVDGLRVRSGFGDDWLRLWGLKFVMDGGVAGAGMEEPFANNPSYTGHLNWDPDEMTEVVAFALERNWKIGTHAVGDRTVRTVLDVYERALEQNPGKAPGTLVLEHAFLADEEQRARAIRLGIAVTVQHPLLYTNGSEILTSWGPERTRRVMPVKSWLRDGAMIAAGTDQVRPFNPMLNIWGMVTRGTKDVGVQGPEEAVDAYTAIELYTAAGTRLTGEADRRGRLVPGQLADFVAYRSDPVTTPPDDLPGVNPVLTCVGGRAAYDPEELLAALERVEVQ